MLEAVGVMIDRILARCPGVSVLATSRERLGIAGERIERVSPLATPPLAGAVSLESVRHFAAVQLFTDRALLVRPNFALDGANANTVAQICRRLEGIPLALEMAAAQMHALSAETMLDHLDDRFRMLGRRRVAASHQRTLGTTLDWSHALLTSDEKVLFRRLSAFVADFGVEAAEAVCGFEPLARADVLVLLSRLVDKCLVTADPGSATGTFRLLETLREYARLRLNDRGESEFLHERHAQHFLSVAETNRPLLRSLENGAWLARMIQEEGNLRAALEWSANGNASANARDVGLRLATALGPFWESRGLWAEGRQWIDCFLERLPEPNSARGQALFWAGWLGMRGSGPDVAQARGREAQSIAENHDDHQLLAMSLLLLGHSVWSLGHWAIGEKHLQESERLFASISDPRGLAIVLAYRAMFRRMQGDLAAADQLADMALAFACQANMEVGSSADTTKTVIVLQKGDRVAARARWVHGLRRTNQEVVYVAFALSGLAAIAAADGRTLRALRLESAAVALSGVWVLRHQDRP